MAVKILCKWELICRTGCC